MVGFAKPLSLAVAVVCAGGLTACESGREQPDAPPAVRNEPSLPPVIPQAQPGTPAEEMGRGGAQDGPGVDQPRGRSGVPGVEQETEPPNRFPNPDSTPPHQDRTR